MYGYYTNRLNENRKAVIYARVSTEHEEQLSALENQKDWYKPILQQHPEWEVVKMYVDEGITGTKKEIRPAMMRMVADCEKGCINRILVKSLSRFARNTTDCLELVRKLLRLGVTIYFEKENIDTGAMESELLLAVMSSLAESESVSISENNKWGVRHRFENGTFKISCPPYGYNVKDGIFSVNEEEAKWVRFMFSEVLAGKSTYRIAKELDERSVPTRKGGRWSSATVKGIIQNEKYIGDCLLQKKYTDFRFQRHHNHGERDQFYMTDHHEPIISREDFEAAGEMIAQHAKEKNTLEGGEKFLSRYPFSGRIICGECGSTFKRRTLINDGRKSYAWACRRHVEHSADCTMKAIREPVIEDTFTAMMNKLIFGRKEVLQDLLGSIRRQNHTSSLQRINEIESALDEMSERRKTLTTIMTKGYLEPAAYTKETNDLLNIEASLEEKRDRLVREINGDMKKTEELRKLIAFTGEAEMLTEFDSELFEKYVDHITVVSRERLVFNLKCGLNLEERIREG